MICVFFLVINYNLIKGEKFMSKYELLWKYIKDNNKDKYKLSYEEVRNILGFEIDHSFLTYKKELKEFGYEVDKISLKDKTVIISKIKC